MSNNLVNKASRLLEQLDDKRPRRAIDLDSLRYVLAKIVAEHDIDALIDDLVQQAWSWGSSCGVDNIGYGETGDSHNQMMHDRVLAATTKLQAAVIALKSNPYRKIAKNAPK